MYTRHGHQIPNTKVEGERPQHVARCGGPRLCSQCSIEALKAILDPKPASEDDVTFTENTLYKVYDALRGSGLSEDQSRDAISNMQNAGILFRERATTV